MAFTWFRVDWWWKPPQCPSVIPWPYTQTTKGSGEIVTLIMPSVGACRENRRVITTVKHTQTFSKKESQHVSRDDASMSGGLGGGADGRKTNPNYWGRHGQLYGEDTGPTLWSLMMNDLESLSLQLSNNKTRCASQRLSKASRPPLLMLHINI
jgi:hypothetical protein